MKSIAWQIAAAAALVALAWSPPSLAAPPAGDDDTPPAAAATRERGTRLQGRAVLGRRQGVIGASVVARATDDPTHVFVTSSDGRGAFRLDGLPDGDYAVEVRRDGLRPVRKTGVAVRFPFRAVVELQMAPLPGDRAAHGDDGTTPSVVGVDPVELTGRVLDDDGRPLSDAMLRLVSDDASADPRVARSGSGGRFSIAELPAGRWALDLRGVGYLPIRTSVSLGHDTTLLVTMIRQPSDYLPTPLELMPPERALPPPPATPADTEPTPDE